MKLLTLLLGTLLSGFAVDDAAPVKKSSCETELESTLLWACGAMNYDQHEAPLNRIVPLIPDEPAKDYSPLRHCCMEPCSFEELSNYCYIFDVKYVD